MKFIAAAAIIIPALSTGAVYAATPAEEQARIACDLGGKKCAGAAEWAEPAGIAGDGSVAVGLERGFDLFGRNGAASTLPTATTASAGTRRGPNFASVASSEPRKRRPVQVSFRQGSAATSHPRGASDMELQFENGSADLSSEAKAKVANYAKVLLDPTQQLTDARFTIEGHTNAVGARNYNLDLSRRRAQSVVDYLVSLGVARERLMPQGLGFEKPLPGTASADANNRRVEIVKAS